MEKASFSLRHFLLFILYAIPEDKERDYKSIFVSVILYFSHFRPSQSMEYIGKVSGQLTF